MMNEPLSSHLEMVTYNKNALNNLRRAIVLGQGQFSLILARVNYRHLRQVLLQEIAQHLRVSIVALPPTASRLRDMLLPAAALASQPIVPPQALMITGLEDILALEPLLKSANLGRDELPKTFQHPVVLWVNDTILQQLNRYAPDLKSFAATPIRFEYPIRALIAALTAQANSTFHQLLETKQNSQNSPHPAYITSGDLLLPQELVFALDQLDLAPKSQDLTVDKALTADLLFLQARNLQQQGEWLRSRSYYENSLTYWQTLHPPGIPLFSTSLTALDKQAILLFHLGLWWRNYSSKPKNKGQNQGQNREQNEHQNYEKARQYFESCLATFWQQNRPDRVGQFMVSLAEVLRKLEDWPALTALAQTGITLHQQDPIQLARHYGYLAEVALARAQVEPLNSDLNNPLSDDLNEAKSFAEQALALHKSQLDTPRLRHAQGRYRYLLATAQQLQGQPEQALAQLEIAKLETNPRYDLELYRNILDRLWHLYFEHKRYAQAFEIKLAQRRVDNLFGLRAFIGASPIQPLPIQPPPIESLSSVAKTIGSADFLTAPSPYLSLEEQHLAAEIKASGRLPDIEALIGRLSQPRYPIVVIHGQSGVGKSSMLRAGLVPRLRSLTSEGRGTLPVLINSYGDWMAQVEGAIAQSDTSISSTSSTRPTINPTLIDRLKLAPQEQYQQIVLIFDQFEDFFYERSEIEDRRELYIFLRDCLELPYIKVVLSLREDFLHYLLEWDRNADLSIIDNDILSKEIRYYLGNLMPKAAENLIRYLTQSAAWELEEGLITALVDDLVTQAGDVRPIEMQLVGAQLQREGITTLAAYQQLGRSPKNKLLKNFVSSVVHDCGPENSSIAQAVLYLLSEGHNRPLKSYLEIEEALVLANMTTEYKQIEEQISKDLIALKGDREVYHGSAEESTEENAKENSGESNNSISLSQLPLVLHILMGSGLIFEVPEVSGVRYQLAHEYIASLVQQQPSDFIEAIKTERQRLRLTEEQLRQALAAQSDSAVQTTLARQQTKIAEIKALISSAQSLHLSGHDLEALAKAMQAASQITDSHDPLLKMQAALRLDASLRESREKNELTGHRDWVLAVDCSPSFLPFMATADLAPSVDITHLIASGSEDSTIKLWDHRGRLIQTLSGHQAGVVDVRFSPDGAYLASASLDHTVRLWGPQGEFIRAIEHPAASVTSISFSPTEPILAASYSDSDVRLWRLDGTLVSTLQGHEDWARTVAFSPDGQIVATGGEDQTVRLWTLAGDMLQVLRGYRGWVRSVAFSPDGQTVICAGDASSLRLWTIDGRKLKTFYGHEDWVRSVAFSPDGQRIASASDDQTVRIWRLDGTVEQIFDQRSSVHSLAWSADGASVVSGGDDDQVHIWRLMGPSASIGYGHVGIVWGARWGTGNQPTGSQTAGNQENKILSAGGDDTIRLWRDNGELLKSIEGHQRSVHSAVWSPKGDTFASASADHSVRLWTGAGDLIAVLSGHESSVWQVAYSPDGRWLASVSSDRTLRLWTAPEGELIQTWTGHTDTIWHVSISPDGQHLATASEDGTLRLWHRDQGLLQTLADHAGGVWCTRFSADGRWLASGGADSVIRLWSIKSINQPPSHGSNPHNQSDQSLLIESNPWLLRGHRDWIRSLSFDPQGAFLASGSDDGALRLWSLPAAGEATIGQMLLPPLTGHEGVVWDVDFDSTGERIVSASGDGTVRIWDLRLAALMEKGCDWLKDWLLAKPELAKQICKAVDEDIF